MDENEHENESPVLPVLLFVPVPLFASGNVLLLLVTGAIPVLRFAPGLLVLLASVLLEVEVASFWFCGCR